MSKYKQPDITALMMKLKDAGADKNLQVTGALWITDALEGAGHNKTPRKDVDNLRKALKHLEQAKEIIAGCDPWFHAGKVMDEIVTRRIDEAAKNLRWVTTNHPGGHQEQAHEKFIDALRRFFISNGLPIALTTRSPFVSILGHCIGQDDESVKTTLVRKYGSDYFQETTEEKAMRPLKAASDEAHAAYVLRLNPNKDEER